MFHVLLRFNDNNDYKHDPFPGESMCAQEIPQKLESTKTLIIFKILRTSYSSCRLQHSINCCEWESRILYFVISEWRYNLPWAHLYHAFIPCKTTCGTIGNHSCRYRLPLAYKDRGPCTTLRLDHSPFL